MNRRGLLAFAGLLMAVPLGVVACGDDDPAADGTLPPIITTTTTTISLTTTTFIPETYTIEPGDNIGNIAVQFGVDKAELMALNGIVDQNHIEAGDTLQIPPATTVPASTTTSTTIAFTGITISVGGTVP